MASKKNAMAASVKRHLARAAVAKMKIMARENVAWHRRSISIGMAAPCWQSIAACASVSADVLLMAASSEKRAAAM